MSPLRPTPSVPAAPQGYAVVGTAGHIDHGKSALVRALTGIDPDRLEEEKRRGMTIDLGFAHFDLPSGRRVGLVDVPGHERLIRNMLAGSTGLDLVLLVIAADEGVMPQTREHLDILRFLRVQRGILVFNKIDLVTDPEWLPLVIDDTRALVAGSFLEGAPIVSVSAHRGDGIPALVAAIDDALQTLPPREVDAPTRLPVDRSFTMPGFGTVVTGTLWTGRVRPGDLLELLPAEREVRVRQVQSHGVPVVEARAGQRVALNIVGAAKGEVARGHVLAAPGAFQPTAVLDVRVRLLGGAPDLKHNERIRCYVAADEVIGRIRLLDRGRIGPGETAPAQLRLERSTVVARGDPFVLRRYSPMTTIGGGEVITARAPLRRRSAAAAQAVVSQEGSGVDGQLTAALGAAGRDGTTADSLAKVVGATRDHVAGRLADLAAAGEAVDLRGRLFAAGVVRAVQDGVLRTLEAHHAAAPWRRGMPRDDLKSRAFGAGDDRLYGYAVDALVARGEVAVQAGFVSLSAFRLVHNPLETSARRAIEDGFRRGRFGPPSFEEAVAAAQDRAVGERMLQTLLDDGTLVHVGGDITVHREALAEIESRVVAQIEAHGEVTVAGLRDLLGTSRKFALTVLEYFDARHVTRRVGDKRVLVRPAPPP
ncbi:MAG TPA: selenocysteine-specific translation elongation factor [bacterium]|nr:selenocysteine-specific translation elongation factor [bacterium]